MNNKSYLPILMLFIMTMVFTGCEEMNSRVDEQLNNINQRAEELDSAVSKGLDRVESLDSTITAKSQKIRNLDSITRKTTSRIDSLLTKGAEEINTRIK